MSQIQKNRGRDRSKVRCFNCQILGHFDAKCRKLHCNRELGPEANLAQTHDDEPTLLTFKCEKEIRVKLLLTEGNVVPRLNLNEGKKAMSFIWYLDNGTRNHMTCPHLEFWNWMNA